LLAEEVGLSVCLLVAENWRAGPVNLAGKEGLQLEAFLKRYLAVVEGSQVGSPVDALLRRHFVPEQLAAIHLNQEIE
jgi:hypothetical protein